MTFIIKLLLSSERKTINAISMLHGLGISNGSKGKFYPSNPTSRARAAKILVNSLDGLK
ncbi:S-layer homology domain-containing protein [Sporosarcina sp. ANT_H38]|uniref:S-layer homology domain-containing protein n=1 Tax=Sporosarcina sp. ANT_H38 TaxID=2597358 RepID=UPI0011F0E3CD|nr:S-layer homology domain-containing protein [Sporosarcina sp. ANT_H38]KAA0941033.1 S-layer homology domain-containing protein [Sporosarcina sp. ANT_H38]